MSKQEWIAELPRLRARLNGEILNTLKFSYKALNDEDKELFLHIACFFNDEDINHIFEDALSHKFSNMQQGLRVLAQRCLISDQIFFPMHNLLVQLGKEIVRQQSVNDPGKRKFLVDAKEIGEVLADHRGSKSVIGIKWNISSIGDEIILSESAFNKMPNLQYLKIDDEEGLLDLPQGLNNLPPKLRILHWDHFRMTCLPSNFNPKFLVKIVLRHSMLEKLWDGIQPLVNLKVMDLGHARNLKELPDLSKATNVLKIDFYACSSLIELHSSIENATNISYLNLSNCSRLVKLPSSIGNIKNLRQLYLNECSSLQELPSSIGDAMKLQILALYGCSSLVQLPLWMLYNQIREN